MDDANEAPSPLPLPADARPHPVSPLRMIGILFIGALLGTLLGGTIVFRMPKIYASQARIEEAEHSGHAPQITRLRAEMVVRDEDFENRWVTTFNEATEHVRNAVRLKPDKGGVTVEVLLPDPRDAKAIANDIALFLDTPARENEMAAKGIHVGPQQKEDWAKQGDIANLKELMADQAVEAGFHGTWSKLLLGPGDDPVLIELAKNEDFTRRLAMAKQLIVETGYYGPPGEPIHPPNEHVTPGELSMAPVAPNVALWMNGFRLIGMLLAGLLILALLRWKPATLRPAPQAPLPKRERQAPVENSDPW